MHEDCVSEGGIESREMSIPDLEVHLLAEEVALATY